MAGWTSCAPSLLDAIHRSRFHSGLAGSAAADDQASPRSWDPGACDPTRREAGEDCRVSRLQAGGGGPCATLLRVCNTGSRSGWSGSGHCALTQDSLDRAGSWDSTGCADASPLSPQRLLAWLPTTVANIRGAVPAKAQADSEADGTDLAANQEPAAQAPPPRHLGRRPMAGPRGERLAEPLRGTGQQSMAADLCVPSSASVDGGHTPSLAAASLSLETTGTDDGAVVDPDLYPAPVAGPTVCRQAPAAGAA